MQFYLTFAQRMSPQRVKTFLNTALDEEGSPLFFSIIATRLKENHEERKILSDITAFEKAGANIYAQNYKKRTLLHYAAKNNYLEVITNLLDNKVDKDFQDEVKNTPLHLASLSEANETVNLLLQANANPDLQNKKGDTALHLATWNKNNGAVKLLLDAGANPNLPNLRRSGQRTALHFASMNKDSETVKWLLDAKADPNLQNADKNTALHIAAINGDSETVKWLLEAKADLNLQNADKKTALHIAALNDDTETVKLLLDAGANPDLTTYRQQTALHIAVKKNNIDLVKILLGKGANPDSLDTSDNSSLELALRLKKIEIAKELQEAGADISLLSRDMQVMLLMREKGIQDVVEDKNPDYKMLIESFRKYARPYHNEYLAGLSRFFHGQWNHHHSKPLTTLLMKPKYRQNTMNAEAFNEFMLELTQSIDLASINPNGALNRLLKFTSEQTGKDWKVYSSVNEDLIQLQGGH